MPVMREIIPQWRQHSLSIPIFRYFQQPVERAVNQKDYHHEQHTNLYTKADTTASFWQANDRALIAHSMESNQSMSSPVISTDFAHEIAPQKINLPLNTL